MEGLEHRFENEPAEIASLGNFDMQYFHELEGPDGWIAQGSEDYSNQKYFTVLGKNGDKLGIVGVYDTDNDKNIIHYVVDPKYRGQGLATKFSERLMDELSLPFITSTIDLDNKASIRATENIKGARKVSDEQYEKEYHKVKYVCERPRDKE